MLSSASQYDGRVFTVVNDDDSFAKTDVLTGQIVEFILHKSLRVDEHAASQGLIQ